MLAQKYRFHSRGGVNYVYQKGKSIHNSTMTLVFTPNNRGFRRFAVVVSKKILKSAVGRNRIRRRIYEAIRLEGPNQYKPMDGIFILYSPIYLKMPFSELRMVVRDLLERSQES